MLKLIQLFWFNVRVRRAEYLARQTDLYVGADLIQQFDKL